MHQSITDLLNSLPVFNRKILSSSAERLDGVLMANDTILFMAEITPGIIALTSDRVITASVTISVYAYDKISSIEKKSGLIGSTLWLIIDGRREMINIPKKNLSTVAEIIEAQMIKSRKMNASTFMPKRSVSDEIEKLIILRDKGVLNEEEFQDQKFKLLYE